MAIADTFANSILDAILNQVNLTADTAIYLSLHTADPGTTGASEVSDATYARQNVTAAFPSAASHACSNNVAIEYPAATTGFTAAYYGIWTAASGGTFRMGGDINPDKVVGAGEILRFATGQLTISLAAA